MTAVREIAKLGPGTKADRPRVEAIVRATGLFREDETAIALELFDLGRAREDEYELLAARDDQGQLIGFISWGPTPATKGTHDLYWIAVDPAHQGHGVGSQLLEAVEERLKADGGRLVVVETSSRPEYRPTRAFYGKRGYAVTARVPGYYAPGDDLIVFTKTIAAIEGGV